ncbi:hypothetical protein ACFOKF_10885 [Sphingobium rhizovicinum]|uniref:DUF4148 domain-containing protein n=1 Tax=Sphingobium rhizovicinum TaxID=432308 RepID=A0ABV7NDW4_9SPHN
MRNPALLFLSMLIGGAAMARNAPGSPPHDMPAPVTIRVEPSAIGIHEVEQARAVIRKARKSGALDRKEARRLRREADRAQALADRNGRDGLSYSEQRELDMQGRALQSLTEGQRSQPRRP